VYLNLTVERTAEFRIDLLIKSQHFFFICWWYCVISICGIVFIFTLTDISCFIMSIEFQWVEEQQKERKSNSFEFKLFFFKIIKKCQEFLCKDPQF